MNNVVNETEDFPPLKLSQFHKRTYKTLQFYWKEMMQVYHPYLGVAKMSLVKRDLCLMLSSVMMTLLSESENKEDRAIATAF